MSGSSDWGLDMRLSPSGKKKIHIWTKPEKATDGTEKYMTCT
jgi:hypothetical protein